MFDQQMSTQWPIEGDTETILQLIIQKHMVVTAFK